MGLGTIPLWTLVSAPTLWLGMDAGRGLGAGVGMLASVRNLLWLGAFTSLRGIYSGGWLEL